jgi:DNA modification methylase
VSGRKAASPKAPKAPPESQPPASLGRVEGLVPSTDPTAPDFAWWPIARVKPWVQNPRRNKKAIEPVAKSISKFGWGRPLIVNVWPGCVGELIIGHTAWLAAQALRLEQVPVRIRRMEPALAHALAIADNKLGEISDWDPEELGRIVGSGEISGEDLAIAGFSQAELHALSNQGQLEEDDVPAPPAVPVTQPGDLWVLGDHRLVCGDSTNADHVALALGGAKPRLMVTDPPYGVSYEPRWRHDAGINKSKRVKPIANDGRATWLETWRLFGGDVAYVWHGALHAKVVEADLAAAGLLLRAQIIWNKSAIVIGRGNYHWKHEPCLYVVRKGATASWVGGRKQSTVWDIASKHGAAVDEGQTMHSTQKPLEAMARPIRNHEGDVYDPFLGSGTTLIAAQKLGRRCFGLELDPGWCDVIVERWKNLTGAEAQRRPAREAA